MPSRYKRKSQTRDPFKKIIIAMEGNVTEPKYFQTVKNSFTLPTLSIIILKRDENDSHSSPNHVIQQLDNYKKNSRIDKIDELWLIIDKDRWPREQINRVLSESHKNNYKIAMSNPCFEIWLILHYKDISKESEKIKMDLLMIENINKLLNDLHNTYKISSYSSYIENISTAIDNAKQLDNNTKSDLLETIGTRVYRLLESINNINYY